MPDEYRKLREVKYYSDRVNVGVEGYNPALTLYYNSAGDLIKIKEAWRGDVWEQTISGTKTGGVPVDQVIDHQLYYDSWIKI